MRRLEFDALASEKQKDPDSVLLSSEVLSQLHCYLMTIAALCRDKPFHNFACLSCHHVGCQVVGSNYRSVLDENNVARQFHDHTYGITSDPFTDFAVILAAVIHDVDHSGVPNSQLIKEWASTAAAHKNKSVAEQNSADVTWNLLMEECCKDLSLQSYFVLSTSAFAHV